MNIIDCFTREQLQQYVLGKLPHEVCDQISTHLDDCEVCEDTIVGLDPTNDTLVDLLADSLDSESNRIESNENESGFSNSSGFPLKDSQSNEESPEFQLAVESIRSQNFQSGDASITPIPDTQVDQAIGVQIGDYELEQQIASGGMGSVFRARHTRLERTVAIKILPERKMQNSAAISRFKREMKIIGQMNHPSMVSATDAGEADGTHYLVMELVDGLDLSRIVRTCGPLSTTDACEAVRQSALGLQYAHDQDVIHRDVKPSNLMLTREGTVKILDLGLATLGGLHGAVDELTTVGQLLGTLDYMAPEQCGNNNEVDSRTDVYGLGATLYKLLSGLAPYSSDAANTPLKKLKAMAIESPTPIQNRRADLPAGLPAIIEKCIAREPDNRFQDSSELAVALEPFCEGHSLEEALIRAEQIRAEKIRSEQTRQLQTKTVSPAIAPHTPVKAKPSPLRNQSLARKPETRKSRSWVSRWFNAACLLGLIGLMTWGGILIVLQTTAGELVIKSEIEDISVSLIQDEKPTKEITIEHGKSSTSLRAGKYRILIKGDSDGLVIKNGVFELKRGSKVVATISKRPNKQPTKQLTRNANTSPGRGNPLANNQSSANPQTQPDNRSQTNLETQLRMVDLENEIKLAEIQIDSARNEAARVQALNKRGAVSSQEAQSAISQSRIAEQKLEGLHKQHKLLKDFLASNKSTANSGLAGNQTAANRKEASGNQTSPTFDSQLRLLELENKIKLAQIQVETTKKRASHAQLLVDRKTMSPTEAEGPITEARIAIQELEGLKQQYHFLQKFQAANQSTANAGTSKSPSTKSNSPKQTSAAPSSASAQILDLEHQVEVAAVKIDLAKEELKRGRKENRHDGSIEEAAGNLKIAELDYARSKQMLSLTRVELENQRDDEERKIRIEIKEKKELIIRSEQQAAHTKKLFDGGYVTKATLDADQMSLSKYKEMLRYSEAKLEQFHNLGLSNQQLNPANSYKSTSNKNLKYNNPSASNQSTGYNNPSATIKPSGFNNPTSTLNNNAAAKSDNKKVTKDAKAEWPTYRGAQLPAYIESSTREAIQNLGIGKNGRSMRGTVSLLARKATEKQVTGLLKKTIASHKNEISIDAQIGIAKCLVPLCVYEAPTKELLKRFFKLADDVDGLDKDAALELAVIAEAIREIADSQFETIEQFMLVKAEMRSKKRRGDGFIEGTKNSLQARYVAVWWLNREMIGDNTRMSFAKELPIDQETNRPIAGVWLDKIWRNASWTNQAAFKKSELAKRKLADASSEVTEQAENETGDAALLDLNRFDSMEEELVYICCRTLAWNWGNDTEVIRLFGELLESPYPKVRMAAIQFLTKQNPKHPGLVKSIVQSVEQGFCSPRQLVLAIENETALSAIEDYLANPTAGCVEVKSNGGMGGGRGGMMGFEDSGEGGAGDVNRGSNFDFSQRIELISALGGKFLNFAGMGRGGMDGGMGGGGTPDSRTELYSHIQSIAKKHKDKFLPFLKRELELATDESVLERTWKSISNLSGEPIPNLVRGRTFEQWLKQLDRQEFSEANAEECLRAIYGFRNDRKVELDIQEITAIAKALRKQDFGKRYPSGGWQGALSRIFSLEWTTTAGNFVNAIDHFDDEDADFVVFVAGHFRRPDRRMGEENFDKLLRWCLDQLERPGVDEQLFRRALCVATKLDGKTARRVYPKRPTDAILTNLIKSKTKPIELKFAILNHLNSSYSWWSRTSCRLLNSLATSRHPKNNATFLAMAVEKKQQTNVPDVLVKLLAENNVYLDEVHQPIKLDLWNGPIEEEISADKNRSSQTLFEQIVIVLEAWDPQALQILVPNKDYDKEFEEDFQQLVKAKKTLIDRYRSSSGATKRKLARVLKTLAPEVVVTE